MIKAVNILLLLIFVNFLSAPTVMAALDIDLPTANLTLSEEEETHSSCKKTNSFSEEELKYFSNFNLPNFNPELGYQNNFTIVSVHSISDDLVLKIPSPPPEAV